MKKLNFIFIPAIFLLSLCVLTFKLDQVPNGIYVDEAISGVNAYSILKTGKDEYGKDFPIAFRFFGSYSPPLYVYLTTIPVWIIGLNEFSIRIISVLSASLMVFTIYYFLKTSGFIQQKIIPFFLLLFIITPWNFFYARVGYELYLGFFLFSLGVLFCWLSLQKSHWLIPGLIVLSISTYASHPQIYSAPIFIIGFLVMYYKQINIRFLTVGLIVSLLIQIPHIMILNTKAFLNKSDLFYLSEILLSSEKIPLPQIISVPLSFAYSFFARTVTYFSPESLFFFADPDPQRSMPELSVFFNWMVVPYFIGIFVLLKNIKKEFAKLLILLITVSVIPASLTRDPFSTQRALNLLLPLFILICLGIVEIYNFLKPRNFLIVYVSTLTVSIILLWRSYFVLLPAERAITWNYGYEQLAKIISENPGKNFVIEPTLGKPGYAELAFFLKIDPLILQNIGAGIKNDYYNITLFTPDASLLNFETRQISWYKDIYKDQILVADELAISKNQASEHKLDEIFKINDPRGYPVFVGYQTNPLEKCKSSNNNSTLCVQIISNTIKK